MDAFEMALKVECERHPNHPKTQTNIRKMQVTDCKVIEDKQTNQYYFKSLFRLFKHFII